MVRAGEFIIAVSWTGCHEAKKKADHTVAAGLPFEFVSVYRLTVDFKYLKNSLSVDKRSQVWVPKVLRYVSRVRMN